MTIQRAREILGKEAESYTDEQLKETIINFEILADIAIEHFKSLTPKQRKKWLKKPENVER